MTDYESYQLAIATLELSHIHGESVLEQLRFWASISYGLLALTFIAPQRLTVGASALLLILYVSFSSSTMINMKADLDAGNASVADASDILAENQLSLNSMKKKSTSIYNGESRFLIRISIIYVPGLFLGTIGYLLISTRREYIARRKGHEV